MTATVQTNALPLIGTHTNKSDAVVGVSAIHFVVAVAQIIELPISGCVKPINGINADAALQEIDLRSFGFIFLTMFSCAFARLSQFCNFFVSLPNT